MSNTTTAKQRFQANKPVKAGVSYKHSINGKDYVFQARFNKTLPEFNSIWFLNLTPKEYMFKRSDIPSGFKLQPNDKIILTDKVSRTYVNENLGEVIKSELDVILKDTLDVKVGSRTFNNKDLSNRIRVINIYPFANLNYQEIKFHEIDNYGLNVSISLLDTISTTYHLVVKQLFTPVRSVSANSHTFRIYNVNGYTWSFTGLQPASYDSSLATYTIPNSLITRKVIISFNGNAATINVN